MYLTYGLFLVGVGLVAYGAYAHDHYLIGLGVAAIVIAAIFRRAKDKILVRISKKGVEIQATVIPPPDDPDATP